MTLRMSNGRKTEVLNKYRVWKRRKAANQVKVARAEKEADLAQEKADKEAELVKQKEDKLKEVISRLEAKLICVGDHEKEMGEMPTRQVSVGV